MGANFAKEHFEQKVSCFAMCVSICQAQLRMEVVGIKKNTSYRLSPAKKAIHFFLPEFGRYLQMEYSGLFVRSSPGD